MSHSFSFFLFQGIHNQTRQQLAVLFNVDFVDFHSATERRLYDVALTTFFGDT
jgi:hypothetical protein